MTFPRISLLLLVSALGFLFQLPISAATPPPVVPHWDQTPLIKSSETRTTLALDGV